MKGLAPRLAAAIICFVAATGVASGQQRDKIDEEVKAAWAAVFAGHVNEALGRAGKLLSEIDPAQDDEAYWRAGSTLVEIYQELENDTLADQVLGLMVEKKVAESHPVRRALMQYYLGRDFVRLGKREQGEKFLRALTAGDERQVFSRAQRLAAIFMSKAELDRGNIDQAAIWMRRTVAGVLINKEAAPIEILDVLSEYAVHLAWTRRPLDALALYARLAPIYAAAIVKHSPRYIRFTAQYLQTLTNVGAYAAADRTLADLKDAITGVDLLAPSIKETVVDQDLYQAARSVPGDGPNPVIDRLKKLTTDEPALLKYPNYRIAFSFFALLAGDFRLADEYAREPPDGQSDNPQIRAYDVLLQSLAVAGQKDFPRSMHLARDGVQQLRIFMHHFDSLSSNWAPTLRSEERLVLGAILGVNADRVVSDEDKDTLLDIAQLLNGDRSKLGLAARASRRALNLDLQREDARTGDRLKDIRDRLMDDAVRTLISRIVTPPPKDRGESPKFDASPLTRLEEIEDKITVVEQEIHDSAKATVPELVTGIGGIRQVLRPDEAIVLHHITPLGIVEFCISQQSERLRFEPLLPDRAKQVAVDAKLLTAAVHAEYPPSPTLDESFPADSAYRLYTLLFGGVEDCIKDKSHLLLATDPDLFAFPFNALLTRAAPAGQLFANRDAAWFPKSYAISLLPSVEAIRQLRIDRPPSEARQSFLGIGAPELRGPQQTASQLSLRSLYVERGVADQKALLALPPLPESAKELKAVATVVGAPDQSILLGPDATERGLRSKPLDDYRVISFATHALVAGDIEGIAEPALVLTPGTEASPANDGLLTASKISNLDLDANLVILSACNTAAGDGAASGRGLSGLANAFFFAGARSLAVTQWAVFSEVAQMLGTGLIARSAGAEGVGVAEALRRTMTDYIASAKEDYLAHPRFWGAFIIAGDGAIRPLEGGAATAESTASIAVKSERLTDADSQLEFAGIAKLPAADATYAVGRLKPAPGTKYAGSYLARLGRSSEAEIVRIDPAIAAGPIISVGKRMILLQNTYSEEKKSAALFRLMNDEGNEVWRFIEDGPLFDIPIGAVDVPKGYLLVSTAEDWSGSSIPSPSKLVINLVSTSGQSLSRREYIVDERSSSAAPPGIVAKGKNGNLIVAINRMRSASGPRRSRMDRDVRAAALADRARRGYRATYWGAALMATMRSGFPLLPYS